jgi:hypothetical protein
VTTWVKTSIRYKPSLFLKNGKHQKKGRDNMKKSPGRKLRRDAHFAAVRKYSRVKQNANERKQKRTPKTTDGGEPDES